MIFNERITREMVNGKTIKYVEGTNNLYAVTVNGEVYSFTELAAGRRLYGNKTGNGYLTVRLKYSDGKLHSKYIHRLVLETFVENRYPEFRKYANHKNEIITDNRLENLEWVSAAENANYGKHVENLRKGMDAYRAAGSPKRFVAKINPITGKTIAVYKSIKSAARAIDSAKWNSISVMISNVCSGKKYKKTAKGFMWKFIGKEEYEKLLATLPEQKQPVVINPFDIVEEKIEVLPRRTSADETIIITYRKVDASGNIIEITEETGSKQKVNCLLS